MHVTLHVPVEVFIKEILPEGCFRILQQRQQALALHVLRDFQSRQIQYGGCQVNVEHHFL